MKPSLSARFGMHAPGTISIRFCESMLTSEWNPTTCVVDNSYRGINLNTNQLTIGRDTVKYSTLVTDQSIWIINSLSALGKLLGVVSYQPLPTLDDCDDLAIRFLLTRLGTESKRYEVYRDLIVLKVVGDVNIRECSHLFRVIIGSGDGQYILAAPKKDIDDCEETHLSLLGASLLWKYSVVHDHRIKEVFQHLRQIK